MNQEKNVSLPIYQVDAFTSSPFTGNPAGVCLLNDPLTDEIQQAIAAEMNISETAFVVLSEQANDSGDNGFPLRWFTPRNEVPLCGHATLATAAVLFSEYPRSSPRLQFHTKSGLLRASKNRDGITLDFPADQAEDVDAKALLPLLQAMGIHDYVKFFRGKRTGKYVIHLPTAEDVIQIQPDFAQMMAAAPSITGVGVTAKGTGDHDIVSRYFNPWFGVNEDPVTGTVHTILAPYWAHILQKQNMHARQASARGGEIRIRLDDTGRCFLTGHAVIVIKGTLHLAL